MTTRWAGPKHGFVSSPTPKEYGKQKIARLERELDAANQRIEELHNMAVKQAEYDDQQLAAANSRVFEEVNRNTLLMQQLAAARANADARVRDCAEIADGYFEKLKAAEELIAELEKQVDEVFSSHDHAELFRIQRERITTLTEQLADAEARADQMFDRTKERCKDIALRYWNHPGDFIVDEIDAIQPEPEQDKE